MRARAALGSGIVCCVSCERTALGSGIVLAVYHAPGTQHTMNYTVYIEVVCHVIIYYLVQVVALCVVCQAYVHSCCDVYCTDC